LLAERLELLGIRLRCGWVCDTPDDDRSDGPPSPIEPCPSCPLARGTDDIERYLECLEKRIECLH